MERVTSDDSTSLLSKNVKIEGDIQGEENLQVEGQLKGSIKVTGNVLIGNTGIVEADIEAQSIVIQGNVTGNVIVRQQLEIQPTGRLIGDCTARSIDIKEGAILEGRLNMIRPSGDSGAAQASSTIPEKSSEKDSK